MPKRPGSALRTEKNSADRSRRGLRYGIKALTWDEIVMLASALPEVVPSTSYGTPALKVRGKLLTRLRPEDGSLVLLDIPFDEREMLIEAVPHIFHATPHYDNYPIVLLRLAAAEPETVCAFLERRWRSIASKRAVTLFDAKGPA
ncbi:MmcQ/YjbR family DNA-binding protein [Microvirga sp. 2TAF3]|uniref:MmcQ/YjbR family DNA-binding protein n=1 Tax=Microvirga sp. 2TAF3 TaxID=3233014 RepID=UPI003F9E6E44